MEDEIITLSSSSRCTKPLDTINILVVDDDTTCLSVIAAILKQCKYQVVTVRNPIDALYMLRIKGDLFDLVVTDVHMPDMNGFDLQKAITKEFDLPVVLMSADNGEAIMLKGLETGAAFFITKPVLAEDVRDLWQYVAMKKKTKASVDEETVTNQEKGKSPEAQTKRDSKRPLNENDGEEEDRDVDLNVSKKAKVVWTNALHNKFLEAISALGLNRAVPKKILELMQVPGLTRENVASHLQKYRIFLKRVSDSSYMVASPTERSLTNRAFRLNIGSGNNSMFMPNKFTPFDQQGDANLALTRALHGFKGKDIMEGSSSNTFFTQGGFKQTSLLSKSTKTWKPNPLSQIGIKRESINPQGSLVFNGGISSSSTNTISHLLEKYLLETPVASLGSVRKTNDIDKAPKLNYVPDLERTTNMTSTPSNIGNQLANPEPLVQNGYEVVNPSASLEGINSWINNSLKNKILAQNGSLAGFGGGPGGDNGGGNHYSTTNTKHLAQGGLLDRFGGGPSGDNGGGSHYSTITAKNLPQGGSLGGFGGGPGGDNGGGSPCSTTNTKHLAQGGSLGGFGGGPGGENLAQGGSLGGFGGGTGGDNGGSSPCSTTNTKQLAQGASLGGFSGIPSGDNGGGNNYSTTNTKNLAQGGSLGRFGGEPGGDNGGGSHYSTTNTKHLVQGGSLGGFGGGPSGDNGGGSHYSTTNITTFTGSISGPGVPLPPSFGNGQETQPPIHPTLTFDNISTPQLISLDDLTNIFFNQLENPAPSSFQGIGGEGGINSNFPNIGDHINNAFQWCNENYNQQGQACLTDANNFETGGTSQIPMNNTIIPTASENDEDAFLESLLASDPFEGEDNLGDLQ